MWKGGCRLSVEMEHQIACVQNLLCPMLRHTKGFSGCGNIKHIDHPRARTWNLLLAIKIPYSVKSAFHLKPSILRSLPSFRSSQPSKNSIEWVHRYQSSGPRDAHPPTIPSIELRTAEKNPKSTKLIERIQPYLELSRVRAPIGTVLLFLPCGSSLALAASSGAVTPQFLISQTFLFGLGAFVMRGAGCTINDLWDRSIDSQVSRTQRRPLASGAISPTHAVAWLGLQLSIGLAILLQLNVYSILLGASSLSLVIIYPLMKRITHWPQLLINICFRAGIQLGRIAWVISDTGADGLEMYDTIYAQQDKKSDILAGVKSTALLFGPRPKPILAGFSTAFVGLTALSGFMNGCGVPFYCLAVLAPALHLSHILRNLNPDSPFNCHHSFIASAITGSLVWLGCLVDYCLRVLPC
ncbi:hypothetical protein VP01_99g6 [Puccinia sorghi]|uniref:4-hydroxybenzoate polyprenyltransferase, mitochondrial n=1 Tax=Puccinia sorghi TaxID=27349 RepID=A0A0L6U5P5_9BASI|nr:hypothetical protein VP01_99g6 [Puccinia sorghi]